MNGGLNVVVPNVPILTCMLDNLPWSVAIPVVVYRFTWSIDLKPSLSASFISFAVESFWKSIKDLHLPSDI